MKSNWAKTQIQFIDLEPFTEISFTRVPLTTSQACDSFGSSLVQTTRPWLKILKCTEPLLTWAAMSRSGVDGWCTVPTKPSRTKMKIISGQNLKLSVHEGNLTGQELYNLGASLGCSLVNVAAAQCSKFVWLNFSILSVSGRGLLWNKRIESP